jgi:glycosyltransferase involved in cell wall biosynthesis
VTIRHVPYVTFPFANRRGTTVLDRSTAYPLFGWRAGRVALALARSHSIDIVHAFGASGLGYALGRRAGDPPLVMNPQGLEEFGASAAAPPGLKRWGYAPLRTAVRATANRSQAVIATDRTLAPVVKRHLRTPDDRLLTIPNGIDLADIDALADAGDGQRIRERHGVGADDVLFLSVGRLEHNKGFDVLARALGRAAQAGGPLASRNWHWVLAGAGPYQDAIRNAVDAEGIASHVTFTGRTSTKDLHAWYEAATVFVHPSRYEGSSLVTLEAMAHRRAIIATRAGGLPDKVRPGVNGWLVAVESVEELSAALRDAVSAAASLPAMGDASRRIVEQDFSWTVLVDAYLAAYERVRRQRG